MPIEWQSGSFVIGAAYHFIGNVLATMTATMALSLAMMGATIWQGSYSAYYSAPNIAISWQSLPTINASPIPGISKKSPIKSDHCQLPEFVGNDCRKPTIPDLRPTDMAAIFARDMVGCDDVVGETYTWAEIQIQYRRYAKPLGWQLHLADRILSKALKDVGAVRGQRDLRAQGKGRPITITFPTREDVL